MSFEFHPRATIFSLLGLVILISLGSWQLVRYLDAKDFEQQRDARIDDPIVELRDPDALNDGELDFRRLAAEGYWDDERLFLINHRVHDGEPGWWVVRPLQLHARDFSDGLVLPVNLGWISRQQGPEHARELLEQTPDDSVSLTGLLHLVDDVVADDDFRDGLDDESPPDGVVKLDTYDIEAISRATPGATPDRPVVLTRSPDDAGDDEPRASYDHVTDPYLTAETHFGYMLTWYFLAIALIGIWLAHGFGVLRSQSYAERAADQADAPDRSTAR